MNPKKARITLTLLVIVAGVAFILAVGLFRERSGRTSEPAMSSEPMGESANTTSVAISPTQLQTLGVRVDTLEYRRLDKIIRTIGRVDYDEQRLTIVSTKVSGWIEKLYVDYAGQFVRKQEPLYEIYSPEVVSAEEEYLLALGGHIEATEGLSPRWQKDMETLLASSRRKLEFWDVPGDHIRELAETHEITKTMMMHSPANGFVLERNVLEGSFVKPGHELFKIADISRVWVYADIYEYELPLIEVGQTAELSLSYFPGEAFTGTVAFIYPYLEEKTRTAKIRFEFPNPGWRLKPGMFANVQLSVLLADRGLALPEEAVLDTGERQIVFVQRSEGVFEPRQITVGPKAGGYYLVLEGLAEGEVVAVSANFLIDSESRLGSAMMKMKM